MLEIKQGKEVLVLILHEIYGINDHMKMMADHFVKQGFDVIVPDLIRSEKPFSYEQEQQAYKNFTETIGFEEVFSKVRSLIDQVKNLYKEIHIVGFSIGATIAWLLSDNENVTTVTGFYGSRIRHYLEIIPACPVLLIYGEQEKSFEVQTILPKLVDQVSELITMQGQHGFADPYAPEYHAFSFQKALTIMKEFHIRHSAILF